MLTQLAEQRSALRAENDWLTNERVNYMEHALSNSVLEQDITSDPARLPRPADLYTQTVGPSVCGHSTSEMASAALRGKLGGSINDLKLIQAEVAELKQELSAVHAERSQIQLELDATIVKAAKIEKAMLAASNTASQAKNESREAVEAKKQATGMIADLQEALKATEEMRNADEKEFQKVLESSRAKYAAKHEYMQRRFDEEVSSLEAAHLTISSFQFELDRARDAETNMSETVSRLDQERIASGNELEECKKESGILRMLLEGTAVEESTARRTAAVLEANAINLGSQLESAEANVHAEIASMKWQRLECIVVADELASTQVELSQRLSADALGREEAAILNERITGLMDDVANSRMSANECMEEKQLQSTRIAKLRSELEEMRSSSSNLEISFNNRLADISGTSDATVKNVEALLNAESDAMKEQQSEHNSMVDELTSSRLEYVKLEDAAQRQIATAYAANDRTQQDVDVCRKRCAKFETLFASAEATAHHCVEAENIQQLKNLEASEQLDYLQAGRAKTEAVFRERLAEMSKGNAATIAKKDSLIKSQRAAMGEQQAEHSVATSELRKNQLTLEQLGDSLRQETAAVSLARCRERDETVACLETVAEFKVELAAAAKTAHATLEDHRAEQKKYAELSYELHTLRSVTSVTEKALRSELAERISACDVANAELVKIEAMRNNTSKRHCASQTQQAENVGFDALEGEDLVRCRHAKVEELPREFESSAIASNNELAATAKYNGHCENELLRTRIAEPEHFLANDASEDRAEEVETCGLRGAGCSQFGDRKHTKSGLRGRGACQVVWAFQRLLFLIAGSAVHRLYIQNSFPSIINWPPDVKTPWATAGSSELVDFPPSPPEGFTGLPEEPETGAELYEHADADLGGRRNSDDTKPGSVIKDARPMSFIAVSAIGVVGTILKYIM